MQSNIDFMIAHNLHFAMVPVMEMWDVNRRCNPDIRILNRWICQIIELRAFKLKHSCFIFYAKKLIKTMLKIKKCEKIKTTSLLLFTIDNCRRIQAERI